ncbi:MAG TPA: ABC transporter permease [Streptosporangiaceae bacterium]|nr:ABC transporter permease [Streptosporangiaceae bacterium]
MRLRALSLAITRAYVRDKLTLFFTFIFPLIFLVVFGLLFGHRAVGDAHYIDYTAIGVMCWGVGNSAMFGVAYTLMYWRSNDVLRLIRMTPTRLPTVVGSRFLVAVVVALAQAVFFVAVATLPVFGLYVSGRAVLALPVLLTGVAAFFGIGLLVGTFASSAESIGAIGNCVIVPMAFLSGTFYPISASPVWMQDLSRALPLRYLVQGTGGLIAGTSGFSSALVPCAALLGFTVLFAGIAARYFRWNRAA